MWFLAVGLVLLALKMAEIGPVAGLSWGWVLLPFGLAAVWWAIADSMGITQRRAMDKLAARQQARRERDIKALGLDVRREKRIRVLRDSSRHVPPPEGKRREGG